MAWIVFEEGHPMFLSTVLSWNQTRGFTDFFKKYMTVCPFLIPQQRNVSIECISLNNFEKDPQSKIPIKFEMYPLDMPFEAKT